MSAALKELELLEALSDAVLNMDEEKTVELAKQAVEQRLDAYTAIEKGLSHGMERAGKLFDEEEYFIPELLLCSDAMYAGLDILKPHLKPVAEGEKKTVVIGVIEGDTHDIGKNIVKIMQEAGGFNIVDLGRDVSPRAFVDQAVAHNASIIAISTLMTTTMGGMGKVIELLKQEGLRDRFKVMIGGGPISQNFATKIGADGYSSNAPEAVKLARSLVASAQVAVTA